MCFVHVECSGLSIIVINNFVVVDVLVVVIAILISIIISLLLSYS